MQGAPHPEPHPEQAEIMGKLFGLEQISNDRRATTCLWKGPHDCMIEMDAGEKPTVQSALAACMYAAQVGVKKAIQKDNRKLFETLTGIRLPDPVEAVGWIRENRWRV